EAEHLRLDPGPGDRREDPDERRPEGGAEGLASDAERPRDLARRRVADRAEGAGAGEEDELAGTQVGLASADPPGGEEEARAGPAAAEARERREREERGAEAPREEQEEER